MALTIYHNPRCSKSRKTLQLIEESRAEYNVVRYLEEPPDARTILALAEKLGLPVSALIRRGEDTFKTASNLPDLGDNEALAAWLSDHPIVLERPIVINDDGRAEIGRPPENVLRILP